MTRRMTLLGVGLTLALTACDACGGGDRRVPFKMNESGSAAQPSVEAAPAAPARPAYVPVEAIALPKGTVEVEVGGTRVNVSPATLVTVLVVDIDADGDRDALAITLAEDGHAELKTLRRNGTALEPVDALTLLPPDTTCVLGEAALRTFAPTLASSKIVWQCGLVDARVNAEQTLLLSIDGRVQLREKFLVTKSGASVAESISLTFGTRDVDEDGRDDVTIAFSLVTPTPTELPAAAPPTPTSPSPTSIELAWLNRPAGFARDVREPDASFARWVAQARTNLRDDHRDEAARIAHEVGVLFDALCRHAYAEPESAGAPIVNARIGDTNEGLACRSMLDRAIASAIEAIVHAKANHPLEAWHALAQRPAGVQIDSRLQNQVQRALASIPSLVPTQIEHPEQAFAEVSSALTHAAAAREESPQELDPIVPVEPIAAEPTAMPSAPLEPTQPQRTIVLTSFGVLVGAEPTKTTTYTLVRPVEWTSFTIAPRPFVVATDGRSIAYERDGRVEVLTLP